MVVDAVRVVAVVLEVEQNHSVVHRTEAVGQAGHIDQVVAEDPHILSEEDPFLQGRDNHGLELLVVLDSSADFYYPAKGLCDLLDCKWTGNQDQCFQIPLLLIPRYLNFFRLMFVQLLLRLLQLDLELCQPPLGFYFQNQGVPSMYYLKLLSLRRYRLRLPAK